MKQFKRRVSTLALSALLFSQGMMADSFVGGRTDFRDESIYFVLTTRFYDGDPGNNVLCWDNQKSQKSTKDPCWRGDFQGASPLSGSTPSCRMLRDMTITAIMLPTSRK